MSTIKVNSISDAAGANGNAITLASDGTCTAKITNNLSNRNLIINGAMNIAQRATSVAVSDGSNEGYQSLDRYKTYTNNSGAYTVSQDTDVPTDYTWGRFRNSYKVDVTTADTSISANDLIRVEQDIEAQDVSNSGWDYTNSSGKLTLSFWAKSVKAGTYVVVFMTNDGTAYSYASEYTLAANTWTHITKTIPGNSNLTINDDNGVGLQIHWILCSGSNWNLTADTWTSGQSYSTTNQVNFFDDAANNFWFTGVQLEVSDYATEFEFKSYGDELARCMRYYEVIMAAGAQDYDFMGMWYSGSEFTATIRWAVPKRANPTLVHNTGTNYFQAFGGSVSDQFDTWTGMQKPTPRAGTIYNNNSISGGTTGHGGWCGSANNAAYIHVSAEL